MRKLIVAVFAVFAVFMLTACDFEETGTGAGQATENKTRQSTYNKLVTQQPAHSMDYSPTRATKNFWIDTWGKKGKLSYVYLLNTTGDTIGYYVLDGLPVSYCTSLTVPYQVQKVDTPGEGGAAVVVPGPSVDGTFSSSANCNVFYGKDATSGAYVEYTTGQGLNALLYDQPLPRFKDAQPLGQATTKNVK